MDRTDVAVIGGGASGLFCALALKRLNPRLRVTVLEKQDRVGRKLLATGNGRCNLTNLRATAEEAVAFYPGGGGFAKAALAAFSPADVCAFFREIGLPVRRDEAGRFYPMSNQAASVLDVLRFSLAEAGAEIRCGFQVRQICPAFVLSGDGGEISSRIAVLAVGGPAGSALGAGSDATRFAGQLRIPFVPFQPALCALRTDPALVRALKGQRVRGAVSLYEGEACLARQEGEILFGEGSVSGIAAMQLARFALEPLRRGAKLHVSVCAADPQTSELALRRARLPRRALEDFLTGLTGKRVGMALMRQAGIDRLSRTAETLTDAELRGLEAALSDWRFPVTGVMGFADAQISAGGLRLSHFDPATMESKSIKGLYAIGEALDVDGMSGGFNLQWAWASAMSCARAAARA